MKKINFISLLVTFIVLQFSLSSYAMSGKWDDEETPKNGWICKKIADVGEDKITCEMCEKEQIRYVHTMEHEDYDSQLDVGCVCAGKMEGSKSAAKNREKQLTNRTERRGKWLKLKGWKFPSEGIATLKKTINKRKVNIILQRVEDDKFSVTVTKYLLDGSFDFDEAKYAAFDYLWPANIDMNE